MYIINKNYSIKSPTNNNQASGEAAQGNKKSLLSRFRRTPKNKNSNNTSQQSGTATSQLYKSATQQVNKPQFPTRTLPSVNNAVLSSMSTSDIEKNIKTSLNMIKNYEAKGDPTAKSLGGRISMMIYALKERKELETLEASMPAPIPASAQYKARNMSDSQLTAYAKQSANTSNFFAETGDTVNAAKYATEQFRALEVAAQRDAENLQAFEKLFPAVPKNPLSEK